MLWWIGLGPLSPMWWLEKGISLAVGVPLELALRLAEWSERR